MNARELSIGDALHERNPFQIPKYQRAYAWKEEQIEDFVKDLRECWETVTSGQNRSHFFGGIVTVLIRDDTLKGHHYKVIDGQQRLATFTILISLIERSYLELAQQAKGEGEKEKYEICKSRADTLRTDYLTYKSEVDGKPQELARLELSQRDNQFFPEIVKHSDPQVDRNSPLSHRNLKNAYDSIRADLIDEILKDANSVEKKMQRLQILQDVVLDYSLIIHITGDDTGEGHRLFQVLNDRGVGLTDGDLLRSRTLELLEGHADQNIAEEVWDSLLSEEISTVDQFLRAFYSSRESKRPRRSNLFDDFSEAFLSFRFPLSQRDADQILKLLQEIEEERAIFLNIKSGTWPFEQDIPQVSRWDKNRLALLMNGLNHQLCIPLLLAAVKVSQEFFRDLVMCLERFVFRYVIICDVHVGNLTKLYMEQAAQIRGNSQNYKLSTLIDELKKLQTEDAPDSVFETNLPEKMQYKRGGNKSLKYFLITIEDYRRWALESGQGKPKTFDDTKVFDFSRITIEHIYPRNARDNDQNATLEDCKNRFGNLSFWSSHDNTRAGNRPFLEKKDRYNKSNVGLNKDLGQLNEWTPEKFNAREKELIELSKKIFII